MDTRTKILTAAPADAGPLAMVAGLFDVLRGEHMEALAQVRRRAPEARLLAVVLERPDALLPAAARAELVAAIRMVDYVLTAADTDVDSLATRLRPVLVVHLEAEDARRVEQLKQHVRGRQR